MPSVFSGFEYDIFISYRHKDNKGEHWVSEFVTALRTELESTFKEDISIYFDENPHDGLLETHDVAKSLQGKLKCLVFIPIISQTYCDPKSYAWQHEFCAFNKMVADGSDLFGRDIKLKNGNVASRILPVKIHDLDAEDKQLLESELGSVLRGVEFIYKSAGVNRPLKPNDERSSNVNRTYYPDQVNKVANAIKEIITGIKNRTTPVASTETLEQPIIPLKKKNPHLKRNAVIALVTLIFIVTGYSVFLYSAKRISVNSDDKSIAILPFKNRGPDDTNEYFSDGMTDEVTTSLSRVGGLNVMSRISVEQYKGTNKNSKTIGEELNVSYLLDGTVSKEGNTIKVSVNLVQAETGYNVWSSKYEQELTGVFQMQSDISRKVADALKIMLSDSERQNLENPDVVELSAYDYYLKARSELFEYNIVGIAGGSQRLDKAIDFFTQSIRIAPGFAKAYAGLALATYHKGDKGVYIDSVMLDSAKNLADKAIQLEPTIEEAYLVRGLYYINTNKRIDESIAEFKKALAINPNYVEALTSLGRSYSELKGDYVTAIPYLERAIKLGRGRERPGNLRTAAAAYSFLGMNDKTMEYARTAALLDGDSTMIFTEMSWLERGNGNYEKALGYATLAQQSDSAHIFSADTKAWALTLLGRYKEALDVRLAWKRSVGDVLADPRMNANRIGHLYWKLGDTTTAMKYFDTFTTLGEESVRIGRPSAQAGFTPYDLAGVYAFLGQKEKAYYYLDQVNNQKIAPAFILALLKDDPMFTSIKNEERFKKIQRELEEKNKKERDRVTTLLQKELLNTKLSPKL